MNHYVWVDLETGGLKAATSAILQIAAIFTDEHYNILNYFASYIKPVPGLEISEKALEVNKINVKALENAPSEEAVMTAFNVLCCEKDLIFAGYNTNFDHGFIQHAGMRTKNTFKFKKQHCIMNYVQNKSGSSSWIKLTDACLRYGVPVSNAHDAMADIKMTLELARQLELKSAPEWSPRQVEIVQQKLEVSNA